MKIKNQISGFTLIEVIIVTGVIAILAGIITPLAVNYLKNQAYAACREEIKNIKFAVTGNPDIYESGSRSSFGFVGDTGVLPRDNVPGALNTLEDLLSNNSSYYSMWTGTPVNGILFGWRGPYITDDTDPWGNRYYYMRRTATAADSTIAVIWSAGADSSTDSNPLSASSLNSDNVTVRIFQDEAFSLINGNTSDECGAGYAFDVTVSYPSVNQILTTSAVSTTQQTPVYFISTLIPAGIRRINFSDTVTYSRNITVNRGPLTNLNLRKPGPCN